ncbi:unnamed protein product, partial [Brenthis ino]
MKRNADPVFRGHPKTQEEKWHEMFLSQTKSFDQNPSLIKLIHNITLTYLNECTPVILYDDQIKSREGYLFQDLFKTFPVTFVHGYIGEKDILKEPRLLQPKYNCFHFIVFLSDVKSSAKVLGKQSKSKVIVVARSSQWAVQEFLSGPLSRFFVNLVVIGQSFKEEDSSVVYTDYLKKNAIEEKGLTLEDTQGMFLLLGAGFLIAGTALLSEWMGGFSKKCRMIGRKMRSSKISHENLIDSPKKSMPEINKTSQSRLRFKSRSTTISNDSDDTLEGEIINVTHESITVHNDFNENDWDSRRSNSVDLDREVEVIFKKETQGRRTSLEEEVSDSVDKRTHTASKDAFGEHVHTN